MATHGQVLEGNFTITYQGCFGVDLNNEVPLFNKQVQFDNIEDIISMILWQRNILYQQIFV